MARDITFANGPTTTDGSRYAGGKETSVGDHPFIKGYFYVFFSLPTFLFSDKNAEAEKYLMVSAEAYTPPGDRQMNIQDIQGQGGVDASFLTGQTISREFSIQYKDYWGAPIFRIHRQWTNYINPYFGTVDAADDEVVDFKSSEYKGTCVVIQTKPIKRNDGKFKLTDIIKVDIFDGVQPMTDLKSAYDSNITSNEFVKPTVQYKFDGYPLDETVTGVNNKAWELLNQQDLFDKISSKYANLAI